MKNNIPKKDLLQALINKFPPHMVAIINCIIDQQLRYKQKRYSQKDTNLMPKVRYSERRFGWYMGKSYKTASRYLDTLIELGWVFKEGDGHDGKANLFSIHPIFYEYAHILQDQFTSLRYFIKECGSFPETQRRYTKYALALLLPLFMPHVLPSYNDNFKINPCMTVSSFKQHAVIKNTSVVKKRREEMEENGSPKISAVLRDITLKLNLTRLGQAKLLMFPDKVLDTVWASSKGYIGTKKSPFDYLFVCCAKYCKEQNIAMEKGIYNLILKRYNINPAGPTQLPVVKQASHSVPARSTFKGPTDEELAQIYKSRREELAKEYKAGISRNPFWDLYTPELLKI